jgi:lysozyme
MVEEALPITIRLCHQFEGFFPQPYLCPAGVPTIGFGTTRYPDGRAVGLGDAPITRERADELLLHDLRRVYLPAVQRLCPGVDTAPRLAAILDWTYNLGAANLAASTLRRRINQGDWQDVPAQLRRWIYAAGRPLRGLARRRDAEAALI